VEDILSTAEQEKKMPPPPMKPADFIREHRRLIKILTKGTRPQQKKEAKDQAIELIKFLRNLKR
jgi:hypothetical protein